MEKRSPARTLFIKRILLATASTSSLINFNSAFSLLISSCCSNWRSLRSSSILAHVFDTFSICSSSSTVNRSSSGLEGDSIGKDTKTGFVSVDICFDCGMIDSGFNISVSTSGNKTLSPF
jgi:hypothetical protein